MKGELKMDAIKYFEEKKRMLDSLGRKSGICSGVNCSDCPFYAFKRGLLCGEFESEHPEEAVAIVEKWAEEHPQKTMLQDFLEKYPNAPKEEDGMPMYVCPFHLGYDPNKSCVKRNCIDCWNRPLE